MLALVYQKCKETSTIVYFTTSPLAQLEQSSCGANFYVFHAAKREEIPHPQEVFSERSYVKQNQVLLDQLKMRLTLRKWLFLNQLSLHVIAICLHLRFSSPPSVPWPSSIWSGVIQKAEPMDVWYEDDSSPGAPGRIFKPGFSSVASLMLQNQTRCIWRRT